VHERSGSLDRAAEARSAAVRSWAFALNATADCSDIEVTLFSFVVVEGLARITGLVQLRNRPNAQFGSVPGLAISAAGWPPLNPVSAHLLPHGTMAWVAWLYRRPVHLLGTYEARIDRVELGTRIGGRLSEPQHGPWVFRFELPPRPVAWRMFAALND